MELLATIVAFAGLALLAALPLMGLLLLADLSQGTATTESPTRGTPHRDTPRRSASLPCPGVHHER